MSKFTDIPYYILKDIVDTIESGATNIGNTFILSPIVLTGFGDKEIEFKIKTLVDEDKGFYTYNPFYFNISSYNNNMLLLNYVSGDTDSFAQGSEVYIRKYSFIHNYTSKKYTYNSVANLNKDYLYLGKIYKNSFSGQYYIVIHNIAEFIINALPSHNRTDKLVDFLTLSFDNIYSQIYEKQKNIWSLIDPFETDRDYLDDIANFYNVDIATNFIEENPYDTRIYVNNIIDSLKRKGTYSSIFIVSKLNTDNKVRVFERWHPVFWSSTDYPPLTETEAKDTTTVLNPEEHFVDFDYLNYYGKTTSESLSGDKVISSGTSKGGGFIIKPTSLLHVQYTVSKNWTFLHSLNSNNLVIQCYDTNFEMIWPKNIVSKNADRVEVEFDDKVNGYVFAALSESEVVPPSPSELGSWYYNHGLGTKYPITSFYEINDTTASLSDQILTRVIEHEVVPLSSGSLTMSHSMEASGIGFQALEGDYIHYNYVPNTTWNITHDISTEVTGVIPQFYIDYPEKEFDIIHNLNSKDLIALSYNHDNELAYPITMKFKDNNTIHLTFTEDFSGVSTISTVDTTITDNLSGALLGTFNHALNTDYIIVQAQDGNNNWIEISDIELVDSNNTEITFVNTQNDVRINFIDPDFVYNKSISESVWTIDHTLESIYPIIQVYDDNKRLLEPEKIEYISNTQISITFSSDETGKVVLKESDFYGKNLKKSIGPKSVALGRQSLSVEWDENTAGLCVLEGIFSHGYHGNELIMSPHYKVQVNLSDFPYNDKMVLSEATIDLLYNSWELVRPASKFAHYELMIEPPTNFSGNEISLYPVTDEYADFVSHCTRNIGYASDSYIKFVNSSDSAEEWVVFHDLAGDVVLQCFDLNFNEVVPRYAEVITENILRIYFEDSVSGYAFVTKADNAFNVSGDDITQTHTHGTSGIFVQCYSDDVLLSPETVQLQGNDINIIYDDNIDSKILVKTGTVKIEQNTSRKQWVLEHLYDVNGLMIHFYDENHYRIKPKVLNISDRNQAIATFDKSQKGYAIIKYIGNVYSLEYILSILQNGYMKFGNGTSADNFNPVAINNIESPLLDSDGNEIVTDLTITDEDGSDYVYIQGIYTDNIELDIYEIGIFDQNDDILFYSYNDQIFKPAGVDINVKYKVEKIFS